MTNAEQFELCWKKARAIVSEYRAECPINCNPVATWVAVGVTVVGAGVSAASQYSAGKKQASAAKEAAGALQNPAQFIPSTVNPTELQWQTYKDAFGGLRNAKGLTSNLNRFDYRQAVKFMKMIQPSFKGLQQQIGENALSFAKGELPADTVASITRAAAQQGQQTGIASGGFGGGAPGMLRNLNLRNLGLTSLDLSKYGTQLGMQVNQQAKSLLPNLGSARDWILSLPQQAQIAEFNVGQQNQAGLYNTQTANAAQQANAQGILQSGLTDAATTAGIGRTIGGAISGTGSLFSGTGGMSQIGAGANIPSGTYPIQAYSGAPTQFVPQQSLAGVPLA
mgnify:CR=1 FL=1